MNNEFSGTGKRERNTRRQADFSQYRGIGMAMEGKLPPQATDLEEAVLGAMLLEKHAPEKVLDIIKAETFYMDGHQEIFKAIKTLYEAGNPVDILTVTEELKKQSKLDIVGGAYYITKLTNRVSSAANIEYHARILIQKYIQRELIRIAGDIGRDAFEDSADAFELLDDAERTLFAIKDETIKKNYSTIEDLLNKAIKQIESLKTHQEGLIGVPSGFTQLDRITSGWQNSDLIILAGRPGMGKTAFVLTIARNAAVDYKKPVAIFSLEMSSIQLVTRLISGETSLESDKLKTGNLREDEWQQLNSKIQPLADAPIFIDDTPALSIFDLKAKARRLKKHHDISMIIIDYLQLMRGEDRNNGNREQEISFISRSLKELAKELDIPVIALAQLSREVEKRNNKMPILSDLRESGSLEQDADMVGFIYRPEYYGINEDENGTDMAGVAQLFIAKHRNGPTGFANMRFKGQYARFEDYDASPYSTSFGLSEPPDMNETSVTRSSRLNNLDMEDDQPTPF
jgi:replicative DNA helicase